jgi:hypothetical protein
MGKYHKKIRRQCFIIVQGIRRIGKRYLPLETFYQYNSNGGGNVDVYIIDTYTSAPIPHPSAYLSII